MVETTPPPPRGLYEAGLSYFHRADEYLDDVPAVAHIARLCNVRPVYLPIASAALLLLLIGRLEDFILGVVGFFYPAWASFKAIECSSPEETRQWLAYWVVYAFFSFLEIFSDSLLFWIPFYYILKLMFLVWLFLPQYQGATVVYKAVIRPMLRQHGEKIDRIIGRVTRPIAPRLQEPEEVDQTSVRRSRRPQ